MQKKLQDQSPNKKLKFSDFPKKIGDMWKETKEHDRKTYTLMNENDIRRYKKEIKE